MTDRNRTVRNQAKLIERPEENTRLGKEHLDGLDGRVVQHLLDNRGFDFVTGDETFITRGLADHLGSLGQNYTATRFAEKDANDNHERNVGKALDAVKSSSSENLVDEAGVNRPGDGTEDRNEGEEGHADRAVCRLLPVAEGAAKKNGSNAAKQTQKSTADQNSGNVL